MASNPHRVARLGARLALVALALGMRDRPSRSAVPSARSPRPAPALRARDPAYPLLDPPHRKLEITGAGAPA